MSIFPSRDSLQDQLFHKQPSLLLNANEWYSEHVSSASEKTNRACFEIASSSRHQREFVTVWRLFQRHEALDAMLSVLEGLVAEYIRGRFQFDTVVTCTSSAKVLFEHLYHRVEALVTRLEFIVLPPHPFLTPDRQEIIDLRGKRVLLFTDVVASGRMLETLSHVVCRLGGEPVAALAAVIVGPQLVANAIDEKKPYRIVSYSLGKDRPPVKFPLFSASDYAIQELEPDDFDPDKVIRIDWHSVWPRASGGHGSVKSLFSTQEMTSVLETAGAIDFDFYEHDGCRFLTGIRLPELFLNAGEQIWARIEPMIFGEDAREAFRVPRLVSTYCFADVQFTSFVESQLANSANYRDVFQLNSTVLLHEHQRFGDVDFIYPAGNGTWTSLEGEHVVLVLASVHSSEKLRVLAADLATMKVARITVLCLLNRMGAKTSSFVTRVRNLLQGMDSNSDDETSSTRFRFVPVYDLPDFESEDLLQVERAVFTLLDNYERRTRVPGFRRWVNQVRKYFLFSPVIARRFRAGKTPSFENGRTELVELSNGNSNPTIVEVRAEESKLSLLCRSIAVHRDYGPLLKELREQTDRRRVYEMYAILLRDVALLRLRGDSATLREDLLKRIRKLRKERFAREESQNRTGVIDEGLATAIEMSMEHEADLWFGVALFAYLDPSQSDYVALVEEVLTCNQSTHQWLTTPENLMRHFADDRTAWMCSFLMLMSYESFPLGEGSEELRRKLRTVVTTYIDLLGDDATVKVSPAIQNARLSNRLESQFSVFATDDDRGICVRRGRDHLSLILTELGDQRLQTRAELVSFLWHHILVSPARHSPINSTLTDVGTRLQILLASVSNRSGAETVAAAISKEDDSVKRLLEDGINTAGVLEQIADAARRLFRTLPHRENEAARYLGAKEERGTFASDVVELGDILQRIRQDNAICSRDLERFVDLRNRILAELWGDPKSFVIRSLRRLNVDLHGVLIEAMRLASESFEDSKYRWQSAFKPHIDRLHRNKNGPKVMYDSLLLRELLKNICLNARYTFRRLKLSRKEYSRRITLQILPEFSSTNQPPKLEITFLGNGFTDVHQQRFENSTLRRQFDEAREFGCDAIIKPLRKSSNGELIGTVVVLEFQAGIAVDRHGAFTGKGLS